MRDRRSSTRSVLTLGAVAATALVWSGCDAKKQTEYVAGVSTQVRVPRDLKSIRIDVSVGGVVQFCRGYKAYDGKVLLPKSLGELPSQGSPGPDPITVTVSGFTEDFSESNGNPVFDNCTSVAPKVGDKSGTRIIARCEFAMPKPKPFGDFWASLMFAKFSPDGRWLMLIRDEGEPEIWAHGLSKDRIPDR